MTDQKRQNRIDRLYERYRTLMPQTFLRDAQKEFNKLIRLRHAVENDGLMTCCTCNKQIRFGGHNWEGETMHAGHYKPAERALTRFDSVNVNCQCAACNKDKSGEQGPYRDFIERVHGKAELLRVETMAAVAGFQWPRVVVAEMVICWRDEIKQLERSLKE